MKYIINESVGRNMDPTNRNNIRLGLNVFIIEKQNQISGELTKGIVQDILTNSLNHPRGIKVRLTNGLIGRVKKIIE